MTQPVTEWGPCPPRFADIKREIAGEYPDFEQRVTRAWNEVLGELAHTTAQIASQGPEVCLHIRLFTTGHHEEYSLRLC